MGRIKNIYENHRKNHGIQNMDLVKKWVETINSYAVVPLLADDYDWLSTYIESYKDSPLWFNLSSDKSALIHFKKNYEVDSFEFIVPIKTKFLLSNKGNKNKGWKGNPKKKLTDQEIPFKSFPVFMVDEGIVSEGNHKIKILAEMGYEAIPVQIIWG